MKTIQRLSITLGLLASALSGQIPPGHAVVASCLSAGGTGLFSVDLVSGASAPLGTFPSAGLAPLAIRLDPVQGNLLLAVEIPGGSRLLRLGLAGAIVVRESALADLPGRVTALAFAGAGEIVAATGGAGGSLYTVQRMGGPPRTLAALPRASALHTHGLGATHAWVAQSGAAGPPILFPQGGFVDLSTGAITTGPHAYTGHTPLGLTGVVDLPTGVPRQVYSQEDGSLALSTAFGLPQVLTPPLPAGATQALRLGSNLDLVALGGQAHPYLKAIQGYSPQAWSLLAGPLPGDPVDFDLAGPAGPGVVAFGQGCGGGPVLYGGLNGGPPRPGNPSFQLEAAGARPSQALLLALGLRDHAWHGLPLPWTLPGGCPLLVSVELPLIALSGPSGAATLPLPVPADPALNGAVLFAQWLQPWGAGLETSNGAAIQVRP